jgi:uncharacterized protein
MRKGTVHPGSQARKPIASLQINVAQLLKQPSGASRSYDVVAEIQGLDADIAPRSPLRGTVELLRTGRGILVEAQFSVALALTCAHCLEPFTSPIDFDLQEEFFPAVDISTGAHLPPPGEDEATLINEQHILDLSEVVRQEIILTTPPYPICRADCAGICPHCGQNLNEGACDCRESYIDPRWEALRRLQVSDQ